MLCCELFGTVRYGNSLIETKIANQRAALEWCWSSEQFDVISMIEKSTDHGKLLSIC